MTAYQQRQLDRLFQIKCLELSKNKTYRNGRGAVVVHHYFGRRHMATRWYIPNGITMTHVQHNNIHGINKLKMEDDILRIKGPEWFRNVRNKHNMIAKYISFDRVLAHLNGEAPYYL